MPFMKGMILTNYNTTVLVGVVLYEYKYSILICQLYVSYMKIKSL